MRLRHRHSGPRARRGSRVTPGNGLIVDLFAGCGGASCGISGALGREPDVALNHDALAMRVHEDNHPSTEHRPEDVWKTRPREVTRGKKVFLLWASPDCTHFSRAKGGKPKEKKIRALAHVVTRWADDVRPSIIIVENVREFLEWGPLHEEGELAGMPIQERKGEYFNQWRGSLELLGYTVEFRLLTACDFGAPTSRTRLFIVARCDGKPVRWPEPSHGPGRASPYNTAASCIDWERPCPSIFLTKEEGRALGVKRPLAPKTMDRIAEGVRRYVLENPTPFIVGVGGRAGQTPPTPADAPVGTITAKNDRAIVVPNIVKVNHGGAEHRTEPIDQPLTTVTAQRRGHALIAPTLIQTGYGERPGQTPRALDLHQPLGTVMATGQKHAEVAVFLAKHFGGVVGVPFDGRPLDTVTAVDHHSLVAATLAKFRGTSPSHPGSASVDDPLPTISAGGNHVAEVRAFLVKYYGTGGQHQAVDEPMHTITALARMGLVTVYGNLYQIVDIGMRMLEPDELKRAQFGKYAEDYDLSSATTKRDQVRLIGNSVCPEVAEALVRANAGEDAAEQLAA
jgi:DNA (cytosine-5)-methyltransferase 1